MKFGGQSPNHPQFWDTHFFQGLGIPKTIFRFDNLLERVQVSLKAVMVYENSRSPMRISPGKRRLAGIQESSKCSALTLWSQRER